MLLGGYAQSEGRGGARWRGYGTGRKQGEVKQNLLSRERFPTVRTRERPLEGVDTEVPSLVLELFERLRGR